MASSDKTLIRGRTIPVSQAIQKKYGRCAALLLQQVHFWCGSKLNRANGEAWVYNTYEAWAEQIGYSAIQVRRVVAKLRQANVLVVENHNKRAYDRTLWYRVSYDELAKALSQQAGSLPSDHNDLMEPIKMIAPIPKMNHKMNAQVISVVPDAPGESQENPTGKTGGKTLMNAKEILEQKAWKETKKYRMEMYWKERVAELFGPSYNHLTIKEVGQLRHFQKRWGTDAPGALEYGLANWMRFVTEAKYANGLESIPTTPNAGFLLKNSNVLLDLYLQSIAPKVLMTVPKVTFVVAESTAHDIYVPQPGDLEKLLAQL